MTTNQESTQPKEFKRRAFLEGNSAGKLPVPRTWGKWFWPLSALALIGGTVWGVSHIEEQVEHAAPLIAKTAGIDPTNLKFNAQYRNVDVTGTLPENTSAGHLEMILAKFDGPNGENIREATVRAVAPVEKKTQQPVVPPLKKKEPLVTIQPEQAKPVMIKPVKNKPIEVPVKEVEFADVRVSAISDGNTLTLTGSVPSQQDADLLTLAARQSFTDDRIINTLTIAELPAAKDNADQTLNEMASVLSNLGTNILDAQIDLDNEVMSGNITTATVDTMNKVKALLPTTQVSVIADEITAPIVLPALEVEDANDDIAYLQSEITRLSPDIKSHVVFGAGSDALQSPAKEILDQLVMALEARPGTSLEIGGHTDSQSSATYNQELSQRRAQAVADYIASQGIDVQRLRPIGYGESTPVASNESSTGRAQNRRVEFWAY